MSEDLKFHGTGLCFKAIVKAEPATSLFEALALAPFWTAVNLNGPA